MAYIEFNHIVKEYVAGETIVRALNDASFHVEKGELDWKDCRWVGFYNSSMKVQSFKNKLKKMFL